MKKFVPLLLVLLVSFFTLASLRPSLAVGEEKVENSGPSPVGGVSDTDPQILDTEDGYAASEAFQSSTYDRFDYVIIVESDDMVPAVTPLKMWKETIGHSVKVVTLDDIYADYSGCYTYDTYEGCDDAAKIWEFLHEKYPASEEGWGIRYVLLVGDIDVLPMRILYPDGDRGDGSGYGTDYYYAKLNVSSWDVDSDGRWGEFKDDSISKIPDVLVGRIPFNDPEVISGICANIISFEQDTGSWKQNALLAHGIMDYTQKNVKNDCAVLAERLKQDIFDPQGWTYTTLYEKGGIDPSTYTCDHPLSQANFENECGLNVQSVVNAVSHGGPPRMSSSIWFKDVKNNGLWDPSLGEKTDTRFSEWDAIQQHPVSAVVFLCGCETGNILKAVDYPSKGSMHLVRTTYSDLTLKEYLENGAVAVIGATAGGDYSNNWTGPANDNWNTLNCFFYDYLINKDKKGVGSTPPAANTPPSPGATTTPPVATTASPPAAGPRPTTTGPLSSPTATASISPPSSPIRSRCALPAASALCWG